MAAPTSVSAAPSSGATCTSCGVSSSRVSAKRATYRGDLESALQRAADAHYEHEKRNGRSHLLHRSDKDEDWSAWYTSYMVAEQAGTDLPV